MLETDADVAERCYKAALNCAVGPSCLKLNVLVLATYHPDSSLELDGLLDSLLRNSHIARLQLDFLNAHLSELTPSLIRSRKDAGLSLAIAENGVSTAHAHARDVCSLALGKLGIWLAHVEAAVDPSLRQKAKQEGYVGYLSVDDATSALRDLPTLECLRPLADTGLKLKAEIEVEYSGLEATRWLEPSENVDREIIPTEANPTSELDPQKANPEEFSKETFPLGVGGLPHDLIGFAVKLSALPRDLPIRQALRDIGCADVMGTEARLRKFRCGDKPRIVIPQGRKKRTV